MLNFDHHCKLLGFCISKNNYAFFFGFLVVHVGAFLGLLTLNLLRIVSVLSGEAWTRRHARPVHEGYLGLTVLFVLCILELSGLVPVLILLIFHVKLKILKISNFVYRLKNFRSNVIHFQKSKIGKHKNRIVPLKKRVKTNSMNVIMISSKTNRADSRQTQNWNFNTTKQSNEKSDTF